jgi:uncharacterized protein (DUF849 family)
MNEKLKKKILKLVLGGNHTMSELLNALSNTSEALVLQSVWSLVDVGKLDFTMDHKFILSNRSK